MPCHSERSEESRAGTENYTARNFARFFANAPLDLQSNRKYGRNAYFCCMKEADRPTVQVNHACSKYDLYSVLDLHS